MIVERNLEQTRGGGYDLTGLPDYAIEVKRREKLALGPWWQQTLKQAREAKKVPVLAYRQSRQPWSVIVPAYLLDPEIKGYAWKHELDFTVTVSFKMFCYLLRESVE